MTTTAPVHCTLADIAKHSFVSVVATVRGGMHFFRRSDNARVVHLTDGLGCDVDLYVDPDLYAQVSQHLRHDAVVKVSAYTADSEASGTCLTAHTIHPIGDPR